MFAMAQITNFGMPTPVYDIKLDKQYTIQEFIDAVISNKTARGHIIIGELGEDSAPGCGYCNGKLYTKLKKKFLCKKVIAVYSYDRYGNGTENMDYFLTVEA